jgi:hypothetical protein
MLARPIGYRWHRLKHATLKRAMGFKIKVLIPADCRVAGHAHCNYQINDWHLKSPVLPELGLGSAAHNSRSDEQSEYDLVKFALTAELSRPRGGF